MAYVITEPRMGVQAIASVETTQSVALGTIVNAADPVYGDGEFVYLKGVTGTVVGSWVTFNLDDGTTTLIVPNAIGPVAVAMGICDLSTKYGWYQIFGKALGKAGDVADSANVYIDSVAGQVDDTVVTGDRVQGAKFAGDDDTATGLAEAEIERPWVDDGVGGGTS